MSLAGRVFVVTGGSRGIGRAIVQKLAGEGARVSFLYRASTDAAHQVVSQLAEVGATVHAHACDVRDAGALVATLTQIEDREGRIDGLINNAGSSHAGLLLTTSDEAIADQIALHLTAPMIASRTVLAGMSRRRAGVILNVGSVAAARPFRGQTAYAASKGGLEAFTRALAVEVAGRGIRVVCVTPGPTRTDMLATVLDDAEVSRRTPLGRAAEPDEIAAAIVFLLSDAASALTGCVVPLDRGYRLG